MAPAKPKPDPVADPTPEVPAPHDPTADAPDVDGGDGGNVVDGAGDGVVPDVPAVVAEPVAACEECFPAGPPEGALTYGCEHTQ